MPRTRHLCWLPALGWAGLLFFLSSQPASDLPGPWFLSNDKLNHAVAFGILAACAAFAFRLGHLWHMPRAAWGAVLVTALYGLSDEIHQHFTYSRTPDVRDWLADLSGALMVAALLLLWHRRRHRI